MSYNRIALSVLLAVIVIFSAVAFPAVQCEAQKFKIPNLLPFKKKTDEVRPFQLTDQSKGRFKLTERPAFDFLKPRSANNQEAAGKSGPLADFNKRSKEFFSKAGEGFGKFADDTRKVLSDSWNPPRTHTAWWNHGDKLNQAMPRLKWPGQTNPQPPAVPRPQMARGYQNEQPRHRF